MTCFGPSLEQNNLEYFRRRVENLICVFHARVGELPNLNKIGSKEYSAVIGIHKAVAQESGAESPKIKPGHKL